MSMYLSGVAVVLAAGSLMAGKPSSIQSPGNFPAYTLVSDSHGGDSGRSGGDDRSGPSERSGPSGAEAGDDHGGHGEMEAGDDHGGVPEAGEDMRGVDVNDQPDDSDLLLVPAHT